MRTLVLGLGKSGRAAAKELKRQGETPWGWDDRPEAWDEETCALAHRLPGDGARALKEGKVEEVVVSPGVSPKHPLYQAAKELGISVVGEAEMAFRKLLNHKCLGITGSNGKTTVTLLTTHVLREIGMAAQALGNVGVALSEPVEEEAVVVAELSSYQLETLASPCLDAGVLLNLTPDHLDRYESMEAYGAAKARLGACLKPGGVFYVEAQAAAAYPALFSGRSIRTFGVEQEADIWLDRDGSVHEESVESIFPVRYRGGSRTEAGNQLAAYLLLRHMGVGPDQFAQALSSFRKPPHRLEWVADIDGISFINDSKGTNVASVEHAVDSLQGPLLLIAGGLDKGSSYLPWVASFKGKVTRILAIGQAAARIEEELGSDLEVERLVTLEEAVGRAWKLAKPGYKVLLSPGCASFDQFRDYEHRGETFKALVAAINNRVNR